MLSIRRSAFLTLLLLVLAGSGCSKGKVKVTGKILKGGAAMVVDEKTYVTLSFVPERITSDPNVENKTTSYSAKFDHKSGTYSVEIPPGRYTTMLVIAPPSRPQPDGKLNMSKPIRSTKPLELTRSQELDVEGPAK